MARLRTVLLRLVRSGLAGGAATVFDLATLTALVSLAGVSPRVANVPALLVGNVVMFVGQKVAAFRARGTDVRRELLLFALVQAGGLALNALLYDLAVRWVPENGLWFVVVRLATTNVVWLAYSFPLWHWVFRPVSARSPRRGDASPPGEARPRSG